MKKIKLISTCIATLFTTLCYSQPNSLDPTFSGDGIQLTSIGGTTDMIKDIALQTDGKIVAVAFPAL